MRLLRTTNFELEEFIGACPAYAILSHRWQDDEISLQDMVHGKGADKAGYSKIEMCCREATKQGLNYAWIDTCCIDKTSSAELTEAINSMYQWYQDAKVCFVYLFDVDESEVDAQNAKEPDSSQFSHSSWWTRGWTLQELIAPPIVEFYNSAWKFLGSKHDLIDLITTITGIHNKMLVGAHPDSFSVAQRMSWASKRTTTRVEDISYSLLGIFGVNMPMLYGEGERAFIRLQEEIMKHSNDHSLFAWSVEDEGYRGLLARSPASFQHTYDVVPSINRLSHVPYFVTNFGLSITLAFVPWAMDIYFVALDCEREDKYDSRIGIYLKLLPEKDQAARISLEGSDFKNFEVRNFPLVHLRQIYVRQQVWVITPQPDRLYGFWIRTLPLMIMFAKGSSFAATDCNQPIYRKEVLSRNVWYERERFLKLETGEHGTAGRIWYESADKLRYTVFKIGFDDGFNPVCLCSTQGVEESLRDLPVSDNKWLQYPVGRKDGYLQGDRFMGLRETVHLVTVSISKEVVGGQRMWVVDIHPVLTDEEKSI
ncbi:HET-domain-containing protein [Cadophora sp. DSE1049]|nr:HET-domain-containing protein [Cadophora sp. DSE1049]